MPLIKNRAGQKWRVFAFDRTTNIPETGDAGFITATLQKDSGSEVATNDVNPTEVADGFYDFDMTQAESNADSHEMIPISASSNIQVISAKSPLSVAVLAAGVAHGGTDATLRLHTSSGGTSPFEVHSAGDGDAFFIHSTNNRNGLRIDGHGNRSAIRLDPGGSSNEAIQLGSNGLAQIAGMLTQLAGFTMMRSTVATVTSQTEFVITGGPAQADFIIGCTVVFESGGSSTVRAFGIVLSWSQNTRILILESDPGIYTIAAGDSVSVSASTMNFNDFDPASDNVMVDTPTYLYDGPRGPGVYFNANSGNSNSVLYTDGTISRPVSSAVAARDLAEELGGFDGPWRIYVCGETLFNQIQSHMGNWEFIGIGDRRLNSVDIGTPEVGGSTYYNLRLTGSCDVNQSAITAIDCNLTLSEFFGTAHHCELDLLKPRSNSGIAILNSSLPTDGGIAEISFDSNGGGYRCPSSFGRFLIRDMTGTNFIELYGGGQLTIHSSCTGGTLNLWGPWEIVDNVAGGFIAAGGTITSFPLTDALGSKGQTILDLEELIEDSSGKRYTTKALEQAPAGGGGGGGGYNPFG